MNLSQSSCRYCSLPIADGLAVTTRGYWSHGEYPCHAGCKVAGEKQEALDCQTIDADCNDCTHYKRGTLAPKTVSKLKTTDGRIVDVIFQPNVFIGGHCLKFYRPTLASPNKWTGWDCFEHRRAT